MPNAKLRDIINKYWAVVVITFVMRSLINTNIASKTAMLFEGFPLKIDIKQQVKGFLSQMIVIADLKDSDNIFERGLVNSMFAMELVLFIEKTFNIKVENEDLDIKNFCSLHAIQDFVSTKLGRSEVEV